MDTPEFDQVIQAARRIRPFVRRTPLLDFPSLDDIAGCRVLLKCENLQYGGAFKLRGATNAVQALTEAEAAAGVATHSSGNHGTALSLAAKARNIPCTVVMPDNSVKSKIANVREAGGTVVFCAPTQAAREQTLHEIATESGAVVIPPYDHAMVISGQGTAALEMLEQSPDLDMIVVPIGGGGLMAGTLLAASGQENPVTVVGAEPAGADDALQSLQRRERVVDVVPNTISDGLRATIGELNFAMLLEHRLEHIVAVDDDATSAAMALLWRHTGMIIEPSSATVVAALLAEPELFAGRKVGCIITGRNVDLDAETLARVAS